MRSLFSAVLISGLFAGAQVTGVMAFASSLHPHHGDGLPHLDLEMTSQELQKLLQERRILKVSDEFAPILEMGKRNLEWIEFINQVRPDEQKLHIHSPATQKGFPIEQAGESNRAIIKQRLQALKDELPDSMESVLLKGAAYTAQAPLPDEEFLVLARKVDSVYNGASRWLLQEPYLWAYSARINLDIRGFYYLRKVADLEKKLTEWPQLDAQTRAQYTEWLIGQCINALSDATRCASEFRVSASQSSGALSFYRKYEPRARETWEAFFRIQNPRRDAEWFSSQPDAFKLPFLAPDTQDVRDFLTTNIEDEWKWGSWQLKLDFKMSGTDLTHVIFVPGATPNVNRLGGSRITMDANRPLTEYTNQWTIRHEFGHVLGIPDCYVEFYDEAKGVMINYQLDVENLMCSRKGKLQQLHFDEMKRVYFR